jgi:methylenetetrahydrofolate dehydrogenase (NADP+)/methenyltetrahydrofolate cyclohydrolase
MRMMSPRKNSSPVSTELNKDADVDGFIVQLPLPKHIDEQKIIMAIDYKKDVDGFHPINVGRMAIGLPCFMCLLHRWVS